MNERGIFLCIHINDLGYTKYIYYNKKGCVVQDVQKNNEEIYSGGFG